MGYCTVHKSQGLTLKKTLEKKEYAVDLLFVEIPQICALENVILGHFRLKVFNELNNARGCKREYLRFTKIIYNYFHDKIKNIVKSHRR